MPKRIPYGGLTILWGRIEKESSARKGRRLRRPQEYTGGSGPRALGNCCTVESSTVESKKLVGNLEFLKEANVFEKITIVEI